MSGFRQLILRPSRVQRNVPVSLNLLTRDGGISIEAHEPQVGRKLTLPDRSQRAKTGRSIGTAKSSLPEGPPHHAAPYSNGTVLTSILPIANGTDSSGRTTMSSPHILEKQASVTRHV